MVWLVALVPPPRRRQAWGRARAILGPLLFVATSQASEPSAIPAARRSGGEVSTAARTERSLLCAKSASFWSRVTRPSRVGYCSLIPRAQAAIWSRPTEAILLGQQAARGEPAGLEAHLIVAAAHLGQGQAREAHRGFQELFGEDLAREVPLAFRVLAARAALLSGDFGAALAHYRLIALSVGELGGSRERARLLIEAAIAASYASPLGVSEARAFLRQSRAHFAPLLEPIQAALELLLELRGDASSSKAAGADAERAWTLTWLLERTPAATGKWGEVLPVLPPGEKHALSGVVLLGVDRGSAEVAWAEYLKEAKTLPDSLRAAAAARAGSAWPGDRARDGELLDDLDSGSEAELP